MINIRKVGHDFWEWLFENAVIATSVLFVAFSIIDISNLNEYKFTGWGLVDFPLGKFFYYIVVILTLVFSYFSYEKSKALKSLENDVKTKGDKIDNLENSLTDIVKEMNELFNSYLTLLVESLNFNHTERISVYKVFDDKFILIGRSSRNPVLEKRNRGNYPINEGFIGKAWEEGFYFIDDLPDPGATERSKGTYYARVNSISPIPRETIDSMSMLSRSFYIERINGYDGKPKAIIVIESKNNNAFEQEDVKDKLETVKQPLIMFIEKNNGVHKSPLSNQEL